MKVIIVTKVPFPNGMAETQRVKCYARSIIAEGVNCEVIICRRTEYISSSLRNVNGKGIYEGVPYFYMGGTPLRGRNKVTRFINDIIDEKNTEKYLRKNLSKGDVLFLYMGDDVNLMLRYMSVAHNRGAFCVRDLCELPYGTGAETKKTIRLRKITLEKQFPKLDGIISISDALMNLAKTYTLPSCKHLKVPILVDYNQYHLPDKSSSTEIPYIFHSGTLFQQKDGILGMIESFGMAVKKLNRPVMFISTGNVEKSPHRDDILKLITQYHLEDKVLFTGFLRDEQLKDYLSRASMVIINKYRTQQNNYCFSTKLGEYLAASKPVIITRVGEAMHWLKENESAYIIEPEDVDALAAAIEYIFSHPKEARLIGDAGQKVCRECFDYRVWGKQIVQFFNTLSG